MRGSQRLMKTSNTFATVHWKLAVTCWCPAGLRPFEDCFCKVCRSWTASLGVGEYRAHPSCFGQGASWSLGWHVEPDNHSCNFTRIIEQRFGAIVHLLLLRKKGKWLLFSKSTYLQSSLPFTNSTNRRCLANRDPLPAPLLFSNGRMKCQLSQRNIFLWFIFTGGRQWNLSEECRRRGSDGLKTIYSRFLDCVESPLRKCVRADYDKLALGKYHRSVNESLAAESHSACKLGTSENLLKSWPASRLNAYDLVS